MVPVQADSEATLRLLERIQRGERAAFDELFAQHRSWLRRLVALRMAAPLQARLDPSDVVQETQLEVFRRLLDFLERRPMPLRLWLRKTLLERLRMFERQHLEAARRAVNRERCMPESSSTPLAHQLAGLDSTPSQQMIREERSRSVRFALGQLAEDDREILFLRTYEGLAYEEISYLLEIDPAAARKRHGRALLRLHKLLTENGVTESQL